MTNERWTITETVSLTRSVVVRREMVAGADVGSRPVANAVGGVLIALGADAQPRAAGHGRWVGPAAALALGLAARPAARTLGHRLAAGAWTERAALTARTASRALASGRGGARSAAVDRIRALPARTSPGIEPRGE